MNDKRIFELATKFQYIGEIVSWHKPESGLINSTYIVKCHDGEQSRGYVLQRVNTAVFKNPHQVMENIENVTEHIRRKLTEQGINPHGRVLQCNRTTEGNSLFVDEDGEYWRSYNMIPDTQTYPSAETPERFYNVGYSFGEFQLQLSDFPADTLHETIPNFHNTAKRYDDFVAAVKADLCGRASSVREEIEFVISRKNIASYIYDGIRDWKFPLRVTHNDTKIDNILIDTKTDKGVCIIDLDTVMPGSVLNDFGDAVRSGAASAAEDEADLDKVFLRLDMFESFTRGFFSGLDNSLTQDEILNFPLGVLIITYELGIRFLTDFLNGDQYFLVSRERHNLDRARNQFKLVIDIESKMVEMNKIVQKISKMS